MTVVLVAEGERRGECSDCNDDRKPMSRPKLRRGRLYLN
jgi:hypothetical protein